MVAAKKPVKKASTAKSKAKKTVRRPAATKASRASRAGGESWQTLRLARESGPFMSFNVTRQTMLWVTLMLVIIVLQVIILIQMSTTSSIIDQVEQSLTY
jgi:hypothetical protein